MSKELKRRIERLEAMFPPLDPEELVYIIDARTQSVRVEKRRGMKIIPYVPKAILESRGLKA